jgi:hypothetical protein
LAAWRRFALAWTGLAASAIFLAKAESRNTMRQVRSLAYKKETDDRIDLDRRSSHKKSGANPSGFVISRKRSTLFERWAIWLKPKAISPISASAGLYATISLSPRGLHENRFVNASKFIARTARPTVSEVGSSHGGRWRYGKTRRHSIKPQPQTSDQAEA